MIRIRTSCLKEGGGEVGNSQGVKLGMLTTGVKDSPAQKGPEAHCSVFQSGILLFWQLQNIQISERQPLFESWHSFIPGN